MVSRVRQGDLSFGADEIEREAAVHLSHGFQAPAPVRQLPPVQNAFTGQVGPAPASSGNTQNIVVPPPPVQPQGQSWLSRIAISVVNRIASCTPARLHAVRAEQACTPSSFSSSSHLSRERRSAVTHITTALLDPFISCCVGRRNDSAVQLPMVAIPYWDRSHYENPYSGTWKGDRHSGRM